MAPLEILADLGEQRSGVPAALRELGVRVVVEGLPAGDYLVAPGILVERKTVTDLHRSVATGRLWEQLLKMRANVAHAWLLIEGRRLDAGQISAPGIRGALLAVIETGIPVLWSESVHDSAMWLTRLASRARAQPVHDRWVVGAPRRRPRPAPVGLLCQIHGISPRLAKRLLERFGSVAGVAAASDRELMSIEGIGEIRVSSLRTILAGTFREAESAE